MTEPFITNTPRAGDGRDPLLEERQKTHGDFILNAMISQKIKDAMYGSGVRPDNTAACEALDMIALKISRICSGQWMHKDHWDDISGYAELVSEFLSSKPKS